MESERVKANIRLTLGVGHFSSAAGCYLENLRVCLNVRSVLDKLKSAVPGKIEVGDSFNDGLDWHRDALVVEDDC